MNSIVNNLAAMNASRQYKIVTGTMQKSTEKLSSGYRINRAADDTAGLTVSEKMRFQVRGLNQGVRNIADGHSLCQVADGALHEVSDMLHRMTELSIQAANDTNTPADRNAINQEMSRLLEAINHISEVTTFNEIPIFKGTDTVIMGSDGLPIVPGDIPFDDIQLSNISLGDTPFNQSSGPGTLGLVATTDTDSAYGNNAWKLIYGNGSTSSSSVRVDYPVAGGVHSREISLNSMTVDSSSYQFDEATSTWSRDMNYTGTDGLNLTVTQSIKLNPKAGDGNSQYYSLSYAVKNNSAFDITTDFMFHADTAYNNNDQCEKYFIDGNNISNVGVYTETGDAGNPNIHAGVPSSISIVDVDAALAFTENIKMDDSNKPDMLSVGRYSQIRDWSYYNNLNSNLGNSTNRMDLGFSMIWLDDAITAGASQTYNFDYGIVAVESDSNVDGVPITPDRDVSVDHSPIRDLWIQQGALNGDGMFLELEEMNTSTLGLRDCNCLTASDANRAIASVAGALDKVSALRSKFGAYTNRLEHDMSVNKLTSENVQTSESRIRDTDMAHEMVANVTAKILSQAGEAMIANSTQANENIIQLLQG